MSGVKTDIQIAREAKMEPIKDILAKINVPDESSAFSPMGRHIAKINLNYLDGLKDKKRYRFNINCFTRMRYLDKGGNLNIKAKDMRHKKDLVPWFIESVNILKGSNKNLIFGHWAALEGKTKIKNIIGLDTGCVYGGKLTAIRLEDKKIFAVKKS